MKENRFLINNITTTETTLFTSYNVLPISPDLSLN